MLDFQAIVTLLLTDGIVPDNADGLVYRSYIGEANQEGWTCQLYHGTVLSNLFGRAHLRKIMVVIGAQLHESERPVFIERANFLGLYPQNINDLLPNLIS